MHKTPVAKAAGVLQYHRKFYYLYYEVDTMFHRLIASFLLLAVILLFTGCRNNNDDAHDGHIEYTEIITESTAQASIIHDSTTQVSQDTQPLMDSVVPTSDILSETNSPSLATTPSNTETCPGDNDEDSPLNEEMLTHENMTDLA